jgi:DNA replication protein DnaC
MSTELFTPPGTEAVDTLCAICGQPMRLFAPVAGEGENAELCTEIVKRLMKTAAHAECADQRRASQYREERAEKEATARASLEAGWLKICPEEFRQDLDFSKCSRINLQRVLQWQFGKKGLLIHGLSGLCKTRFTFQLLNREYFGGRTVKAISHTTFRQHATALASEDAGKLCRFMAALCGADILFLDDLGKGTFTNASEEALCEVIDVRTSKNRPIFYTCNSSLESLALRLSPERGAPMMRRITEHVEPIKF